MIYRIFYQTKKVADTIKIVAKNPDEAVSRLKDFIKDEIIDYEFEDKASLTFNNGKLALRCSKCSKIIKEGKDFSPIEVEYALGKLQYLKQLFCDGICE